MEKKLVDNKTRKKDVVIDIDYDEKTNIEGIKTRSRKENKVSNEHTNVGLFVCLVVVLSVISGFLGAYIILSSNSSNYVSNGGGIVTSTAVLNETNSWTG